jgi:rare lipoprotein A
MNLKSFLLFSFSAIFTVSLLSNETGEASYYADKLAGNKTTSGEKYDPKKFTAAHRTHPFHSILKVTNLKNGKTVFVRVNDKGPHKKTRIIDLSKAAAEKIDLIKAGVAQVKVELIGQGSPGKDPEQATQNPPKKEDTNAKLPINEEFSLEDDYDDEEDEDNEPAFNPNPVNDPPQKKTVAPTKKTVAEVPTKKSILPAGITSPYYDFEGNPQKPTGVGLQIASFTNEKFAIKAATRLMLKGYSKVVIEKFDYVKPTVYRLIVWGYETDEEALEAGKPLEGLGYNLYFIYRFP